MSDLYWMVRKGWPDMGICHAVFGNRFFMAHTNKEQWINSPLEDWEFLDLGCDGALFRDWELVACPAGTPVSGSIAEPVH